MNASRTTRTSQQAAAEASSFEPVRKTRVSGDAVEQIARKIISGDYSPGQRLPAERDLAAAMSITRGSLREALRLLENMGLISVRAGDGIYVEDYRTNASMDFVKFMFTTGVGIDIDFMASIEEVRRMLALEMIRLAADRADDDSIGRLQEVVDGFPRELTPELLDGVWDFRFFHELAQASGNLFFVYMLNTIKDVFRQIRFVYTQLEGSPQTQVEIYDMIVAAIREHDSRKAVELVESRMNRYGDLLEDFRKAAGK